MKLTIAGLLLTLIAIAIGCDMNIDSYPDSESVFRETFNSPAPQSVTNLNGVGFAFGDNSANYLRFNTRLSTANKLMGTTFVPITAKTFLDETSNAGITGPTPLWWKPATNATTKFYSSTGFHPTFSSGQAYYSYDSNSQTIHVYWDGLD